MRPSASDRAPERIAVVTPDRLATHVVTIATAGEGFYDITDALRSVVRNAGIASGQASAFVRHTSASLTIQENADPDVQRDLLTALRRLAPRDGGWVHTTEGPDDMPAHIRTLLSGVSLTIPVIGGQLALGTWQGVYLIEHRAKPHRREVVLQVIGGAVGKA